MIFNTFKHIFLFLFLLIFFSYFPNLLVYIFLQASLFCFIYIFYFITKCFLIEFNKILSKNVSVILKIYILFCLVLYIFFICFCFIIVFYFPWVVVSQMLVDFLSIIINYFIYDFVFVIVYIFADILLYAFNVSFDIFNIYYIICVDYIIYIMRYCSCYIIKFPLYHPYMGLVCSYLYPYFEFIVISFSYILYIHLLCFIYIYIKLFFSRIFLYNISFLFYTCRDSLQNFYLYIFIDLYLWLKRFFIDKWTFYDYLTFFSSFDIFIGIIRLCIYILYMYTYSLYLIIFSVIFNLLIIPFLKYFNDSYQYFLNFVQLFFFKIIAFKRTHNIFTLMPHFIYLWVNLFRSERSLLTINSMHNSFKYIDNYLNIYVFSLINNLFFLLLMPFLLLLLLPFFLLSSFLNHVFLRLFFFAAWLVKYVTWYFPLKITTVLCTPILSLNIFFNYFVGTYLYLFIRCIYMLLFTLPYLYLKMAFHKFFYFVFENLSTPKLILNYIISKIDNWTPFWQRIIEAPYVMFYNLLKARCANVISNLYFLLRNKRWIVSVFFYRMRYFLFISFFIFKRYVLGFYLFFKCYIILPIYLIFKDLYFVYLNGLGILAYLHWRFSDEGAFEYFKHINFSWIFNIKKSTYFSFGYFNKIVHMFYNNQYLYLFILFFSHIFSIIKLKAIFFNFIIIFRRILLLLKFFFSRFFLLRYIYIFFSDFLYSCFVMGTLLFTKTGRVGLQIYIKSVLYKFYKDCYYYYSLRQYGIFVFYLFYYTIMLILILFIIYLYIIINIFFKIYIYFLHSVIKNILKITYVFSYIFFIFCIIYLFCTLFIVYVWPYVLFFLLIFYNFIIYMYMYCLLFFDFCIFIFSYFEILLLQDFLSMFHVFLFLIFGEYSFTIVGFCYEFFHFIFNCCLQEFLDFVIAMEIFPGYRKIRNYLYYIHYFGLLHIFYI